MVNKEIDNIAALGKYLLKNFKETRITPQKEEEILTNWCVSSKNFNRIFGEYKSLNKGLKIGSPGFSQKGANNSRAKPVRNIETGETFPCIIDAAINLKMNVKTLRNQMRHINNKTPIRYK